MTSRGQAKSNAGSAVGGLIGTLGLDGYTILLGS